MKIGLFGGTFDPPHMGHLIVAWHVLQDVELDRIIFMPGATPPHKQDRQVSPAEHRVAMLRSAIEGNSRFEVSEAEAKRGGVSFTVDTLLELQTAHPGDTLYFLLGMDNLVEFDTWKKPDLILQISTLVVMTRPGFTPDLPSTLAPGTYLLSRVPSIGISSSAIRTLAKDGKSIRYLVPESVERYISEKGLYR